MRVLLFFMLFVFAVSQLNAQSCKYISNITSGMDGTRQVITAPYKLASSKEHGKVQVWSKLYQDSLVVVAFAVESATIQSLDTLEEVEFTFTNTEKESFPIMNALNPSAKALEKYTIYLNLNKAKQDVLSDKSVQQIEFNAKNGKLAFPVKKKSVDYIGKVIRCTISAE